MCISYLFLCPAVAARCYDGNSLVQLSSVRRQRARSARTVRWLCTVHTVAPRSGPLACSTLTLLSNCGSHSWRRVRRCRRGLDGRLILLVVSGVVTYGLLEIGRRRLRDFGGRRRPRHFPTSMEINSSRSLPFPASERPVFSPSSAPPLFSAELPNAEMHGGLDFPAAPSLARLKAANFNADAHSRTRSLEQAGTRHAGSP